jgi:hypothetical protein
MQDDIQKGSLVASSYEDAQGCISEFFAAGSIKEFEKLRDKRKEAIRNVIGYDDGKNHIRAAEIIYKILTTESPRARFSLRAFPFISMAKRAVRLYLDSLSCPNDFYAEVNRCEHAYDDAIKKEIHAVE